MFSSHSPLTSFPCPVAESVQTGQVVAHSKHADQDHWQLAGCPQQLDTCPGNHRLHLCCGGHSVVWADLQDKRDEHHNGRAPPSLAHV